MHNKGYQYFLMIVTGASLLLFDRTQELIARLVAISMRTAVFQTLATSRSRWRLSPDSRVKKPRQGINGRKRPLPHEFFTEPLFRARHRHRFARFDGGKEPIPDLQQQIPRQFAVNDAGRIAACRHAHIRPRPGESVAAGGAATLGNVAKLKN
jgi:hypothetical protein